MKNTTDSNKDAAISFLKLAAGGYVREAYSKFVCTGFRHHNPYFEGSAEALMAAMEENARQNPSKVLEVKRAIAEGEFVVVHSTFWSSLAGLPDVPENYQTVQYELSAEGGGTRLTITQDNNATQEEANHSAQNWQLVLHGMKQLLES